MTILNNVLTADEGKVLRRISDQRIFGGVIHLGYTHYLDDIPLEEPLLEIPEHFEEIEDPSLVEEPDEEVQEVTEVP